MGWRNPGLFKSLQIRAHDLSMALGGAVVVVHILFLLSSALQTVLLLSPSMYKKYSVLFLVPQTNALLPRLANPPCINGEGKLEYVGSDRTEQRGQRLEQQH
jgi:hypothetical protein